MIIKKFIAPNTREALAMLRAELGEDAIILSTKRTSAGTEVLGASNKEASPSAPAAEPSPVRAMQEPMEPRPRQPMQQPLQHAQQEPMQPKLEVPSWTRKEREAHQQDRQVLSNTSSATPKPSTDQASSLRQVAAKQAEAAKALAAAASKPNAAALADAAPIVEEIKQMRQLLKTQMSMLAWRDALERDPMRGELWSRITEAGFSALFARTLADRLPKGLNEDQANTWAMNVLMSNVPVAAPNNDLVEEGGVYALVGPTGVGKTTTTAKLAARCVVKYGAESLGLITTDSYRIGAQDQLRIYGKILGVQVYTAQNFLDLQQLRHTMQRKRLILIDTVGMGQRDNRLAEQTRMLSESDVGRVLLLNATSQPETLDDVVRHYKCDGLQGAIITKLDEAVKIGGVLDVVMRHKLLLNYLATGQRVPEDLFRADARVLVHRALRNPVSKAFKASPEELKWKMVQSSL